MSGRLLMNCPQCGGDMVQGRLIRKTSFFSTAGRPCFENKKYYFEPEEGKKQRLKPSLNKRSALRCPVCGLVAIPEQP
jgi:predicted RNA-binding Zn-ribbon protein involved in translation (DUF1610 family)